MATTTGQKVVKQDNTMKLRYEAQVVDEDTDEILGKIDAPTMEMLEEQLGKLETIVGEEPRPCKVEECGEPYIADRYKLCSEHYKEMVENDEYKHGDPEGHNS